MSDILKVATASLDITPGDKNANLDRLKKCVLEVAKDVDLIVVPELFSTGFSSNQEKMAELAETNGGNTVSELRRLAMENNIAICGSFLVKTGTAIYNRAFFIEPNGDETFYDKRHLFSMSSESKILSAGKLQLPVVRYRGWNIAVAVCYDLRFPVWCRNNGLKYDLLIIPANWPSSREYAWRHLLIARAIENQAYVIGVDRSGEDKFGNYDNMSMAFDYCGKEIATKSSGGTADIIALDHQSLDHWRNDFTAWSDADGFDIVK